MASDSNAFYSQNVAWINTFDVIGACLAGFLDNKAERSGFLRLKRFCLGTKRRKRVMNMNCTIVISAKPVKSSSVVD